jgi:hypothetical protein
LGPIISNKLDPTQLAHTGFSAPFNEWTDCQN